jgi:hypothetical protein
MNKNNLEVVISVLAIIFILMYFGSLSSELVSVKRKLKIKQEQINSLKKSVKEDSLHIKLTDVE